MVLLRPGAAVDLRDGILAAASGAGLNPETIARRLETGAANAWEERDWIRADLFVIAGRRRLDLRDPVQAGTVSGQLDGFYTKAAALIDHAREQERLEPNDRLVRTLFAMAGIMEAEGKIEFRGDAHAERFAEELKQRYAQANGLALEPLARLEPWFVGLSVGLLEMGKLGLDPALGLDRHFMQAAARAGKATAGLELAQEQIAVLAGMDLDEQRQLLADALDHADQGPARSRALHGAWRAGDAEGLWDGMAAEMKRDYPALYRRINTERNDAWLVPLQERLQAGQGTTLVVVGALHLLGSDGVVEKLRARGYRVERICLACTSPARRAPAATAPAARSRN